MNYFTRDVAWITGLREAGGGGQVAMFMTDKNGMKKMINEQH